MSSPPLDIEQVKSELKALRKNSVSRLDALSRRLRNNMRSLHGIRFLDAKTGSDAVDAIAKFSAGLKNILVNRSSTLLELTPMLVSGGYSVRESYYEEFGDEPAEELKRYWELSGLEPDNVWGSLNATCYRGMNDRDRNLKGHCIGLLGVNAVSVEGPSIFFLQHLHNISKILDECDRIVLVVGLEKLVADRKDAEFQTRCSALFGLESMMLDSFSYETPLKGLQDGHGRRNRKESAMSVKAKKTVKEITESFPEKDIMFILLDNGRRRMLHSGFKEIFQCVNCRACTSLCPRIRRTPRKGMSGRDIIFSVRTMGLEEAVRNGLFDCSLCGSCESSCPLALRVPDMLLKARIYCGKKKLHPATHEKIALNMKETGNPYAQSWRKSRHVW